MFGDGVHDRKKASRLTEAEIRVDERVGNLVACLSVQASQTAVIGNICDSYLSLSCPEMDISPLFSPFVGCIQCILFNLFLQSIGVKSNKVISSHLIFRE